MDLGLAIVLMTATVGAVALAFVLLKRAGKRPAESDAAPVDIAAEASDEPQSSRLFNAFILGRVPECAFSVAPADLVDSFAGPLTPTLTALGQLAENLAEGTGTAGRVLALAPVTSGDGATSLAFGIAEAAARLNYRALVIDVDSIGRGATEALRAGGRMGIADVLGNAISASQVVLPRGSFRFMPVGLEPLLVAACRKSFDMFLAETRTRFDLIILDAGAFTVEADFAALAALADTFALVARRESLDSPAFVRAVDALASVSSFAGLILNRVGPRVEAAFAQAS